MKEIHQIKILPKPSISVAKFVKAKDSEYTYFAHPHTIKAMKKDIFTTNDLLQAEPIACAHCQQLLHQNMWQYCPYCGKN